MLVALTTAFAGAVLGVAQKTKTRTRPERIVIGYISDGSCGLQHMPGMDEKECTLMCAMNGKFVLANRDHRLVYELDKSGQDKAPEFAGRKVKVKGRIVGKTIHVSTIEAAG
jgi:hypothetical protein